MVHTVETLIKAGGYLMETQETYIVTPMMAIERDVLEARIAKLREALNAANVQATVAELEMAAQTAAMKKGLDTALNLAHSDKSAVLLAVAAFDRLEAEHKQLFDKARAVADTYGVNSVDFHRAIAQLRASVGQL